MPRRTRRALVVAVLLSVLTACGGRAAPPGLGEPCAEDRDCSGTLECFTAGGAFPGGLCSTPCDGVNDPTCVDDGGKCQAASGLLLCLASCEGGCRTGYHCWDGACRPACRSDSECAPDGRCINTLCVPGDCEDCFDMGMPLGGLGDACELGEDCLSGLCRVDGICTVRCRLDEDCGVGGRDEECRVTAVADAMSGVGDRALPVCAPTDGQVDDGFFCEADAECSSGACVDGLCSGICETDGDCPAGQTCDLAFSRPDLPGPYGGCTFAPRQGDQLFTFDLGEQEIDARELPEIDIFAAPPDLVSLTFQARRVGEGRPISFWLVESPSDRRIFDLRGVLDNEDPPLRWVPTGNNEVVALRVTNSERVAVEAGPYQWALSPLGRNDDPFINTYQLRAFSRRADGGVAAPGALDLHVYLVDVGLTAEEAEEDERLQGMLARTFEALGAAAVSRGTVSYHELGEDDAALFRVLDPNTLGDLFRLSTTPEDERSIDVFLVQSIESREGFNTLGIAGGIPGPVGDHGTGPCGVVVSFSTEAVGEESLLPGSVLAHELGHYLGLYHVTERRGPCEGDDTPFTDDCAFFDGHDPIADTEEGDRDNLMFWRVVMGGANIGLSETQGDVLRGSAIMRVP